MLTRQSSGQLELQWSRPQLRTETRAAATGETGVSPTSMEPSSVEDGNDTRGNPAAMSGDYFNGAVLS